MTNIERSLIDLADCPETPDRFVLDLDRAAFDYAPSMADLAGAIIRARIRFEKRGYKALIETGQDKVRLHVQRN